MLPNGTVKTTNTAAGVRDVRLLPRLRRLLVEATFRVTSEAKRGVWAA
jgi:hypothetical protein